MKKITESNLLLIGVTGARAIGGLIMIRFQIVERDGARLYHALTQAMRDGELQTLFLLKRGHKVVHDRYPGWIRWSHSRGIIDCKVFSPQKPGSEWQLFSAVLGRLAHKYAKSIITINVQFPNETNGRQQKRRH